MSRNILQICTDAADELSLTRPSLVVSADDETDRRLARILTRVVKGLHARYDWQILMREKTFTTLAQDEQTSAVPTDFLRFIPNTMQNRTTTWATYALTPQQWQEQKARVASAAITTQVRRRGSSTSLLMYPNPPAGETIAYEYITNALGTTSGGTQLSTTNFAADTDIPYMDDELLVRGMVWQYRKSEGLDYSEEFRDFELMLFDLVKAEVPRRTLDMSKGDMVRPTKLGIPDTWSGLT